VKSIITKWTTYHTTQTPPQPGQPFKLSSRASGKLVCDVTLNPTMTLKDLQGSMSKMGGSVHQSTISSSLHKAGLDGEAFKKKPFLKKTSKSSHVVCEKASL